MTNPSELEHRSALLTFAAVCQRATAARSAQLLDELSVSQFRTAKRLIESRINSGSFAAALSGATLARDVCVPSVSRLSSVDDQRRPTLATAVHPI